MKPKYYWHIHHGVLFEQATEPIKNRIAYIKSDKPECEVALRLRLLKPVKDQKRLIAILTAYRKATALAWEAYRKAKAPAWKAYKKATALASEAYKKATAPALEAYEKVEDSALEAYKKVEDSALEAYKKVEDSALEAYEKATALASAKRDRAINALHSKECPDCPWDGEMIFPKRNGSA